MERARAVLPRRRVEALALLMQVGVFHDDPVLSARGAACLGLSHLAGVPVEYLPHLRNRDWLPGGREVVVIDPPGFFKTRRLALARTVPAPPTLRGLIERYRALADRILPPDGALIGRDGSRDETGLQSTPTLRGALRRACKRLGIVPAMTFPEARALYNQAIAECDENDGLYQYMCAVGRGNNVRRRFTYSDPPPDDLMAKVVLAALPLATPWRRLRSERGPDWSWDG